MSAFPDSNTLALIAGVGGWAGAFYGASMYLDGGPITPRKAFDIITMPIIWSGMSIVTLVGGVASLRVSQFLYGSMFSTTPFLLSILGLCAIMTSSTLKTFLFDMPRLREQHMPAAVAAPGVPLEEPVEEQGAEEADGEEQNEDEDEEQSDGEQGNDEEADDEETEDDETPEQAPEPLLPSSPSQSSSAPSAIDLTPVRSQSPVDLDASQAEPVMPVEPPVIIAPTLAESVEDIAIE
jgi:hypothetical protein